MQTSTAIDNVRNSLEVQNAKNQEKAALIGGLASVGASYGMNKYMQGAEKRATQRKANETADRMTTKINNGTAFRSAQGFY